MDDVNVLRYQVNTSGKVLAGGDVLRRDGAHSARRQQNLINEAVEVSGTDAANNLACSRQGGVGAVFDDREEGVSEAHEGDWVGDGGRDGERAVCREKGVGNHGGDAE